MATFFIAFFTVLLLLVAGFMVLIVLMQRATSNAGLGSALGGSAMESALGGGASHVLTKATVWGATIFFVGAFGLYLAHMAVYEEEARPAISTQDLEALAPEDASTSALGGAIRGLDEGDGATLGEVNLELESQPLEDALGLPETLLPETPAPSPGEGASAPEAP